MKIEKEIKIVFDKEFKELFEIKRRKEIELEIYDDISKNYKELIYIYLDYKYNNNVRIQHDYSFDPSYHTTMSIFFSINKIIINYNFIIIFLGYDGIAS